MALGDKSPKVPTLSERRALAAIGQARLMSIYDNMFTSQNVKCAQVLLTYSNLGVESQYRSSRDTFKCLFEMDVVPIVNENDPVADAYTKFGDNDTLSAMIAILVHAEKLFLLTDVDGLYTANPNIDPSAKIIPVVKSMSDLVDVSTSTSGSMWGTGGMATKLKAAEIASNCGVCTVIMNALNPRNILREIKGERIGTAFIPNSWDVRSSKRKRKNWIRALPILGEIRVDDGAVRAIRRKQSLFAAGVREVLSEAFERNQVVRICDLKGRTIALGLANYSRSQFHAMKGKHSKEISEMDSGPQELIHRHNIVVMPFKVEAKEVDEKKKEKKLSSHGSGLPSNRNGSTAEEKAISMTEKMSIMGGKGLLEEGDTS